MGKRLDLFKDFVSNWRSPALWVALGAFTLMIILIVIFGG